MDYEQKKEKIIDILKSGERDEDEFRVGFEAEHFVVEKDTLDTQTYDTGVAEALEEIKALGYDASYEGSSILGLSGFGVAMSIEPAAQFEIAFDSRKSIDELFEKYKEVMAKFIPIFEEKGLLLAQVGYQPKNKIDELAMIPKKRYKYMYEYFANYGGSMAHNMMKGSGSLQVALDYKDEEDFRKKYHVANALSVFLYSVFDNAYIFEGEVYPERNLRQSIWENCDKPRTGIYPFSFDPDMGYEKYAEKILATDSIFIKKDGEDIYTGDTKFAEIFDEDISFDMIYHALSIVFPDVRAKRYLEIRQPDNVPYPYNFAVVALIKNMFYDREILDYLYNLFEDMDYETAQKLKEEAMEKGIHTSYKDKEIYEWMLEIIAVVKEDRTYIEPLRELLEKKMTPRDLYENLYKESPQKAIYEFSVNKFVRDING